MSVSQKKKLKPGLQHRLSEVIRERDEASATCMLLVEQVKRLIETLKDTRLAMADQEIAAAERLLKQATRKR